MNPGADPEDEERQTSTRRNQRRDEAEATAADINRKDPEDVGSLGSTEEERKWRWFIEVGIWSVVKKEKGGDADGTRS